jgi:hypothetical protein
MVSPLELGTWNFVPLGPWHCHLVISHSMFDVSVSRSSPRLCVFAVNSRSAFKLVISPYGLVILPFGAWMLEFLWSLDVGYWMFESLLPYTGTPLSPSPSSDPPESDEKT